MLITDFGDAWGAMTKKQQRQMIEEAKKIVGDDLGPQQGKDAVTLAGETLK